MEKVVYIVHAIDTEGPLFESTSESFKRLENYFNIKVEPTLENLNKIQNKQLDFGGFEEQAAKILSPQFLNYIDDYHKLNNMLDNITSERFRMQLPDSFGNGWLYSWHCVDHLDYDYNPRRKDIGMHNIFDFYADYIFQHNLKDEIHWHYHPSHHSRASHFNATNYLIDTKFFKILAHRIIERGWFPSVNRCGFHVERPDSHWILEQWIPYDLSNQAIDEESEQLDLAGGRFGDWRRAPKSYGVYHPHHDDYQIEGSCRRVIGRCLNIGTRMRCITQNIVNDVFEEAQNKGKALIGITDHDFRDMAPDVNQMRSFIKNAATKYPNVKFKYCDSREAFNLFMHGKHEKPNENILSLKLEKFGDQGQMRLKVNANEPTFGPQPFLAIKLKSGAIHYSNFDFQKPFFEWTYVFDKQTFEIDLVETIGVASNDKKGFPHVVRINP